MACMYVGEQNEMHMHTYIRTDTTTTTRGNSQRVTVEYIFTVVKGEYRIM